MIIGLLLVGSLLGFLATVIALVSGQTFLIVVLVYFSTSVLSVIAIPLICAFRPRMHRLDSAGQRDRTTALHDI